MKIVSWAGAVIIVFLLQAGLSVFRIFPLNLPLVLMIVSLLFAEFDFGLGLAVGCGVVMDFLSGSTDGTMAITFVVVFLALYFVVNFILARESNLLILFVSVAGGTIVYFLMFLLVNQIFQIFHLGVTVNFSGFFLSDLPKELLFNLLFTYPVLMYYKWIGNLNQKFFKHDPQPIQN